MKIKPFTNEDVDFAVSQAKREGWATGRPYFELHLEHDRAGAFIAWEDDRRVGMITATQFAVTGWLGNLIVEPDYRSRGIGRKLMETGFEYLRGCGVNTIRLDADPPGIPLYRSMGFVDEVESSRFSWKGKIERPSGGVRPFTANDLPAAIALDFRCFGDDRTKLLELMLGQVREAYVTGAGGHLSGFLYLIQSSTGLRIGPCCAESVDDAGALLTAALACSGGSAAGLGMLAPNEQGRDLLFSLGFTATPPCRRMVWGEKTTAGAPDSYYAIAGGAVG